VTLLTYLLGGGVMTPTFRGKGGRGDKVNVENTKIIIENISISVTQLQIKQRNWVDLAI